MSRWVSLPRMEGRISRQAHANLPEGTYEREVGREGFSGPASHIYHPTAPTAWVAYEGDARPRAFDLNMLGCGSSCPASACVVAFNSHFALRQWKVEEPDTELFRNADGDCVLFFHRGSGDFYCDFGHLALREGDYILVPRGTMWRLQLDVVPAVILIAEARNERFGLPAKGLLGEHALFDPAMLDLPRIDRKFRSQYGKGEHTLKIKRLDRLSRVTYRHNPLDAVGWKGTLAPIRINWRDIREVSCDRYHLPPSAHSTFVSPRIVIGSFCPRPLESDPNAMRVPFFHNNDDYDELVFFHHGNFFSRDGMGIGMMTFHAAGVTHGPHPEAYKRSIVPDATYLDEMAINIDTRDPLTIPDYMDQAELQSYPCSWTGYLDE
jgi:homogentisate 1,2-dioxygenase